MEVTEGSVTRSLVTPCLVTLIPSRTGGQRSLRVDVHCCPGVLDAGMTRNTGKKIQTINFWNSWDQTWDLTSGRQGKCLPPHLQDFFFKFMCMPMYICICHADAGAPGGQKREVDPLDLELRASARCLIRALGRGLRSPGSPASSLDH